MPYIVSQRTPSGDPSRYVDTDTGESISARKYRNRTEAQKSGYKTISQKQRASKKHITVSKTGLVQHHYNFGIPSNLAQAISDIIRRYEYKDSFALGAIYLVEVEGYTDTNTLQSTLNPCLPMYIRSAIDEVKFVLLFYGSYEVLSYFITIYPARGDL